jgi:hypothetical protein
MHRVGLLAHGLQQSGQQPGTVVGDDHGGDDMTQVRRVL